MSQAAPEPPPFSAEGFRRRAAGRLRHDAPIFPPVEEMPRDGDHALSPDLARRITGHRPAAVLIPVIDRAGEASVLLTQRTAHLASHAGQIAFPGGKVDAADGSPLVTALREAEEEVGLDRTLVSVIGYLDLYQTGTGFRIAPVVGIVHPEHRLVRNPDEVADVFEVPLSFLMTPENHLEQSRLVDGNERRFFAMPYGERYIWGVTAAILRNLFLRVYGP